MMRELIARGIHDRRVLFAMEDIPRHRFVPTALREVAHCDSPLPIDFDQTISQPYMVALMLQALELQGTERVLEIGAGSGYQAALLGLLASHVYAVEIIPTLARRARREIDALGLTNVHVIEGDGNAGYVRARPYDAIVVAAAATAIPRPLLDQLAEGGRLVMPVGDQDGQVLVRVTRQHGSLAGERLGPCRFVPLVTPHTATPDTRKRIQANASANHV